MYSNANKKALNANLGTQLEHNLTTKIKIKESYGSEGHLRGLNLVHQCHVFPWHDVFMELVSSIPPPPNPKKKP